MGFIDNRSIDTGVQFVIDYGSKMISECLLLSTKNILPRINLEDTLKHATIADKVFTGFLSKYNGIVYPEILGHLSTSDFVSERFISPQIPFTQIRRLRHALDKFGILG
ncbi:hypothetical protein TNCV_2927841 [Trichonephila clavipes]|nr:hypothetical protein TNCV_2927841 [Trichonephila clavipes]